MPATRASRSKGPGQPAVASDADRGEPCVRPPLSRARADQAHRIRRERGVDDAADVVGLEDRGSDFGLRTWRFLAGQRGNSKRFALKPGNGADGAPSIHARVSRKSRYGQAAECSLHSAGTADKAMHLACPNELRIDSDFDVDARTAPSTARGSSAAIDPCPNTGWSRPPALPPSASANTPGDRSHVREIPHDIEIAQFDEWPRCAK